jgi:hypothetical protein
VTLRAWLVETALWAASVGTIAVAIPIMLRSPVGRFLGFVYRKLWKEPLSTGLTKRATTIVEDVVGPQLDAIREDAARLEAKNDHQHASNLKVITDLGVAVHTRLDQIEEVLVSKQRKPKPQVIRPPDIERFDCV